MKIYENVYIFCDLDKTLLFDCTIAKCDLEKICFFKNNGGNFYINTGRPLRGVVPLICGIEKLFNGLSLMNGALMASADGAITYKSPLLPTVVGEIYRIMPKEITLTIETDISGYIYPTIDYEPWYNDSLFVIEKIEALPTENVYQICASLEHSNESLITIKEKLKHLSINIFGDDEFIDINNKSCNKGLVIDKLLGCRNGKFVAAIGDSNNDIHMFNVADCVCVVGNSVRHIMARYCNSVSEAIDYISETYVKTYLKQRQVRC